MVCHFAHNWDVKFDLYKFLRSYFILYWFWTGMIFGDFFVMTRFFDFIGPFVNCWDDKSYTQRHLLTKLGETDDFGVLKKLKNQTFIKVLFWQMYAFESHKRSWAKNKHIGLATRSLHEKELNPWIAFWKKWRLLKTLNFLKISKKVLVSKMQLPTLFTKSNFLKVLKVKILKK